MSRWLGLLLVLTVPAWCARSYISGFELGSTGEHIIVGAASVQTTTVRTGVYAGRLNPSAGTAAFQFQSKAAGGTDRSLFRSVRFYFRFASTDAGLDTIVAANTTAAIPAVNEWRLHIIGAGILQIATNGASANGATLLSTNTWYRVAVDGGWNAGAGAKVYLDGVEEASTSTGTVAATAVGVLGDGVNAPRTFDFFFDDVIWDDASANIGAGQAILLKPISDNDRGTWTGGAGGTTNLWEAINNIPPIGTATETDLTQIENATNTANQNGLFNCQSYTTGGVGASDTVNAVMALVNDGEDIATGVKTGDLWIDSNPAQFPGAGLFDYGDDVGALGTFPSNWRTHVGPVDASPSVTLGTSPVVAIRATSATTRVRSADFLGIYVDYTPAAGGAVARRRVTITQ